MWILCNNFGKKRAKLKFHGSVPGPEISRYGLKSFFCIAIWNSPGVLHNRFLEKSLTLISTTADKNRSHCEKTAKACGPLLLQDTTRRQKSI